MYKNRSEFVISKDKAVFWLDKNGRWHNAHGKFQHQKIINYFHSAIKKDAKGYYLFQDRGDFREKVYFHYEDTPLFVVRIIEDDEGCITAQFHGYLLDRFGAVADQQFSDRGRARE